MGESKRRQQEIKEKILQCAIEAQKKIKKLARFMSLLKIINPSMSYSEITAYAKRRGLY